MRHRIDRRRSCLLFAASSAAVLLAVSSADAQNKTWVGGNGNWSVGTNWNPSGTPGSGDTCTLNQGAFTVTVDSAAGSPTVTSVKIENGGTLTLGTATSTFNATSSVLMSTLGAQASFLNINAGTLTSLQLMLAQAVGSSSTATLSSGATLNLNTLYTSFNGAGTFIQNGGTNNISALLSFGGASAAGTYLMNGGTLSTPTMQVGPLSNFLQTGGLASIGTLTQTGGTVSFLSNSTFGVSNGIGYTGAATWTKSGGTFRTDLLLIGDVNPGTFTQSGGSFSVVNSEASILVGYNAPGVLNINGGTFGAGTYLPNLNVGSYYNPSTGGSAVNLTAGTLLAGTTTVGSPGSLSSNINQTGPSSTANFKSLLLGYGVSNVTGGYSISAGTLLANSGAGSFSNFVVGYAGTGSFSQSGGVVITDGLEIGGYTTGYSYDYVPGVGTYTLSGGTLNTGTSYPGLWIGAAGTGNFNQTGGTLNAPGPVTIGDVIYGYGGTTLTSYGTYTL